MTASDLPWNDEAEKRILNILLSPSSNSAAIMDKLTAEEKISAKDFYGVQNKKIFQAIQNLCSDEKTVDIATVANALNCASSEQELGELKYIASIITVQTALTYYAKIVKELSERRGYIEMAQKVMSLAADTSQPFEQISGEINRTIDKNDDSGMASMKELMVDAYSDIVERFSSQDKLSGLPTEWRDVNKLTGGLGKGEFIVIGGRPGMGKSIIGQNLAEYIACTAKKKALLFTLEMPKKQMCKRVLSAKTGIAYRKFKSGDVDGDDFYKMGVAMETPGLENLMIDDTSRASVEYVKSKCRAEKRKSKGLGIVIIDYIGLMQLPEKSRSRWEGIGEISRELKLLAKELDCPVVALSQITRGVEKERDKRPTLSDLRDTGSLEQDADMVFLLYRDEYYFPKTEDKGVLEVIFAKVRDGKPGTVKLSWQPQIMRVMDFEEVKRLKKQAEEMKRKKYGEQQSIEEEKKG